MLVAKSNESNNKKSLQKDNHHIEYSPNYLPCTLGKPILEVLLYVVFEYIETCAK